MAKDKTATAEAPEKPKAKRKYRTIEERIAELQAKDAAAKARRRKTATKRLEEALAQRQTTVERLERIDATIAELREVLGETGEEAPAEVSAGSDGNA